MMKMIPIVALFGLVSGQIFAAKPIRNPPAPSITITNVFVQPDHLQIHGGGFSADTTVSLDLFADSALFDTNLPHRIPATENYLEVDIPVLVPGNYTLRLAKGSSFEDFTITVENPTSSDPLSPLISVVFNANEPVPLIEGTNDPIYVQCPAGSTLTTGGFYVSGPNVTALFNGVEIVDDIPKWKAMFSVTGSSPSFARVHASCLSFQ